MKRVRAVSLSLVFTIICGACSAFQSEGPQEEAMDFERFGDRVRECYGAWGGLFEEWYREVGSLGPSLLSVQTRIQGAGDSEFSKVVLNAWNDPAFLEMPPWGSWPVSDEVFRHQTYQISEGFDHLVPDECSSASWLYPIVGTSLYIGADGNEYGYMVPNDAPIDFEWSSPTLQHWYVFWLFIRSPDLGSDQEKLGQAGTEDVVLQQSMDCYIYVPKRIVLDDELPLFDHPIRLPCLMTDQDPLEAFSSLAGDLAVGFDEHLRELLVGVVNSTCGGEGGLCENRDWKFWNRFDELAFETYVQQDHSLGMYLSQLKEPLAKRYRIYENPVCFSHGTACELSAEKQVELMIKAAALDIAGYTPDLESIAQALYQ